MKTERDAMLASAREVLASKEGLVERSLAEYVQSAAVARRSAEVLAEIDEGVSLGIRAQLEVLARADAPTPPAATVLVGVEHLATATGIDDVLEDRYESVAKVVGGGRVVARVVIDQPKLLVLYDDLESPSSIGIAVLTRIVAPMTALLIVTDLLAVIADASELGITVCRPDVSRSVFDAILDGLAA